MILTILGVYDPSNGETAIIMDHFFTKLHEVIRDVGNTKELFVLGDFNSRTRRKENNLILGSFGEEKQRD